MTRTRNRRTTPAIDRLLPRLTEVNGCWIFPTLSSSGYGSIGKGRRGEGTVSTHIVTYEYFIGEIPSGLEPDHLCRVPACCNPWHLELVTRKINMERGTRHSKTHCDNGHLRTAKNTMIRPNGKRECRTCHNTAQSLRRMING